MRDRPPYYDDFVKSVSNGRREFDTEEELIDCFEDYVLKVYQYEMDNEDPPPRDIRYVYKVSYDNNPLLLIYVENPADAMEYEDQDYTTVQLIRTTKTSNIYRLAKMNSVRSAIEHFLSFMDLCFKIGGVLKAIEYFGKPEEEFRDN
jgi:hypothetical protein